MIVANMNFHEVYDTLTELMATIQQKSDNISKAVAKLQALMENIKE